MPSAVVDNSSSLTNTIDTTKLAEGKVTFKVTGTPMASTADKVSFKVTVTDAETGLKADKIYTITVVPTDDPNTATLTAP